MKDCVHHVECVGLVTPVRCRHVRRGREHSFSPARKFSLCFRIYASDHKVLASVGCVGRFLRIPEDEDFKRNTRALLERKMGKATAGMQAVNRAPLKTLRHCSTIKLNPRNKICLPFCSYQKIEKKSIQQKCNQ